MRGWKRAILLILLVFFDQVTKQMAYNMVGDKVIIPGFLNISFARNYGAIFGIAQGSNYLLAIFAVFICLILVLAIFVFQSKRKTPPIALHIILAGGIGNVIDRLVRGYVIDFIDTPFIATFNLADWFVVIGTILLIFGCYFDFN